MRRLNLLTGVAISTVTAAGVVLYMQGLRNKLNKAEKRIQVEKTHNNRSKEILSEIMTAEQVRAYATRMLDIYTVDHKFKEQMKNF